MPAIAITDQSNLCAAVKFYKTVRGSGIKPIVGVDIWLENEDEADKPSCMTLLAMNNKGYLNITELVSKSFTAGQDFGKAIVKREWLVAAAEGVIALSGAKDGDVGRALLAGRKEQALERAKFWMDVFPCSYYLELHRTNRLGDEEVLHQTIELAQEINCPVVATNDVQFLHAEDFEAHESRVCISDGEILDNPNRPKLYTEDQYFKSAEEMVELFEDIPEALENTVEIAKRCNVDIRLGECFLPQYPVPDGMTMELSLIHISEPTRPY